MYAKTPLAAFRRKGRQITDTDNPWGRATLKAATIRPTEYRCYIKEVIPYATAGAVTPSWKAFLRPPGKLPVPVALNAGSPTLFTAQYTRIVGKCK